MLNSNYVPLHTHCAQGSWLDSTNMPKTIVKRCKELGIKACALTDHGFVAGLVDFYNCCKDEDIKPILGEEAYFTPDVSVKDKTSRYDHLILLARTQEGYKNLLQLSTLGNLEGKYYKPRIDYKMLEEHGQGIIGSSACLAGTIPKMILDKETDNNIEQQIKRFAKLFDYFYLEIQPANNEAQIYVNKELIRFSKKINIPLIVTTDAHFLTKDDFEKHGVFIQMNQDRDNQVYQDCWLKPVDVIIQELQEQGITTDIIKESIDNTNKIADMCNVEIKQGKSYLPIFPIPSQYKNDIQYFKYLINQGFINRGLNKKPNKEDYIDRIYTEFNVITKKMFTGYFLITQDLLQECRNQNIMTGDGRGSAVSSLICYCLGITNVDPLEANLDFGRFLNIERMSLPDIDSDVQSSRKPDVVNILRKKYGYDRVAQVCNILTMQAKAATQKIGNVYDIPYKEIEKVKSFLSDKKTIQQSIEDEDIPKEYMTQYSKLLSMGVALEGLPIGISTHAGGVVICPSNMDMSDFTGLCFSRKNEIITQLDKHTIEKVGLVKMDILATTILDTIDNTEDLIYGSDK